MELANSRSRRGPHAGLTRATPAARHGQPRRGTRVRVHLACSRAQPSALQSRTHADSVSLFKRLILGSPNADADLKSASAAASMHFVSALCFGPPDARSHSKAAERLAGNSAATLPSSRMTRGPPSPAGTHTSPVSGATDRPPRPVVDGNRSNTPVTHWVSAQFLPRARRWRARIVAFLGTRAQSQMKRGKCMHSPLVCGHLGHWCWPQGPAVQRLPLRSFRSRGHPAKRAGTIVYGGIQVVHREWTIHVGGVTERFFVAKCNIQQKEWASCGDEPVLRRCGNRRNAGRYVCVRGPWVRYR